MAPPSGLEEAITQAHGHLQAFRDIVDRLAQDWVPRPEVEELREEVQRLRFERDEWRKKYETLNASLISAVGSVEAGVAPRPSPLEVPYSLQISRNNRCKIQPVAGGQIVMDCITLSHSGLHWNRPPRTVLISKKPNVPHISLVLYEIATWLHTDQSMEVYVLPDDLKELRSFNWDVGYLKEYSPVTQLDFAVSLGGDGTILYIARMFETAVPPIVSFAMGSMGFMTPFAHGDYEEVLKEFIRNGRPMTIRNRLDCKVIKGGLVARQEVVMNDVVVDRGTSSHLTNLDCYVDDMYCTTVQGDGCILSTPTGSTAYSLSSGGSICHPQVPCIILTPISPHSLSFRPVLFQHSITFRIVLSKDARDDAWVSFDGQHRVRLEQGDELIVQHSRFPVAMVCNATETEDWLRSVTGCLRWNSRDHQTGWKPLPVGPGSPHRHQEHDDVADPLSTLRRRAVHYIPDAGASADRHFTIDETRVSPKTPPCSPLRPPSPSPRRQPSWQSFRHGQCPLSLGSILYTSSLLSIDSLAEGSQGHGTPTQRPCTWRPEPSRDASWGPPEGRVLPPAPPLSTGAPSSTPSLVSVPGCE